MSVALRNYLRKMNLNKMENTFFLKTSDAHCLKILIELLSKIVNVGCFVLTQNGIELNIFDDDRSIRVNLDLPYENFNLYKLNKERLNIGLNLNHLSKLLKCVKKRDTLILSIKEDNPEYMIVNILPKDSSLSCTNLIQIQNTQYINMENICYSEFPKPIVISSVDMQKIIKNVNSNKAKLQVKNSIAQIIYTMFFDYDSVEKFSEDVQIPDTEIEISSDLLFRISKITALSSNLQIYIGEPLIFRTSVGSLGKISIGIKSLDQLAKDNETDEEDNQ